MGDACMDEGLLEAFGPIQYRRSLFLRVRRTESELRGSTAGQKSGGDKGLKKVCRDFLKVLLTRWFWWPVTVITMN